MFSFPGHLKQLYRRNAKRPEQQHNNIRNNGKANIEKRLTTRSRGYNGLKRSTKTKSKTKQNKAQPKETEKQDEQANIKQKLGRAEKGKSEICEGTLGRRTDEGPQT